MKKIHIPVSLALLGVALAGGIPGAAYAEFNLDKLKAMAEKAKVYQERMKQNSQPLPENTSGTVSDSGVLPEQSGISDAGTGGAKESARKKIDIVGVKLGMSLDEAIKALRQHNPKLSIIELKKLTFEDLRNPNHPAHIVLQDGPNDFHERTQIFVSLPPRAQVIEFQRELVYAKGKAPTRANVLTALKEKYGDPSKNQQEYQFSNLTWHIDRNPTGQYIDGCHPKPGLFRNIHTIKASKANCGMMLNARVDAESGNPGITSRILTTLTDHDLIFELASESQRALAGMTKKRQMEEIGGAAMNEKPKF